MSFADKILNFRAKHSLSQNDVAVLFGTDQGSISDYENGKREPSRRNRLIFEIKMQEYNAEE